MPKSVHGPGTLVWEKAIKMYPLPRLSAPSVAARHRSQLQFGNALGQVFHQRVNVCNGFAR